MNNIVIALFMSFAVHIYGTTASSNQGSHFLDKVWTNLDVLFFLATTHCKIVQWMLCRPPLEQLLTYIFRHSFEKQMCHFTFLMENNYFLTTLAQPSKNNDLMLKVENDNE